MSLCVTNVFFFSLKHSSLSGVGDVQALVVVSISSLRLSFVFFFFLGGWARCIYQVLSDMLPDKDRQIVDVPCDAEVMKEVRHETRGAVLVAAVVAAVVVVWFA